MDNQKDEQEKDEGTDLLKHGYRMFTWEDGVFCISRNEKINSELGNNVQWTLADTFGCFKLYVDRIGFKYYRACGLPQNVKKFLAIYNY